MDSTHSPFLDVLVIGGGPVGMALAGDLLRHGISCRIIDMNTEPSQWPRASVLQARTLEALEDLGVAADAVTLGRPLHAINLYEGPDRLSRIILAGMDTPYPFILSLSQQTTETLLARHLGRRGGAVEYNTRLLDFTQDDQGVSVRVLHSDSGVEETIRAGWLVGCDGSYSAVRAGLRLPFEGENYHDVVLQADVHVHWPFNVPEDEVLAFFSAKGPIAAMPLSTPGRWRLQAFCSQLGDIEPSLANFQTLMDERGPHGVRLSEPAWLGVFRARRRLSPCYRSGRVLLAGDAAHNQSPISGQGMNLGLQDAYNLAWKLALAVQGRAQPALLDSYETERHRCAMDTLETADELMSVFMAFMALPSPEAQSVRRQALATLAARPALRGRVAAGAGMLSTNYRDSPIVDEHRGAVACVEDLTDPGLDWDEAPAAGEHAPDVTLALPDGKMQLRELLVGIEHVLLLFGGLRGARPAHLLATAAEIGARYGEQISCCVVLAGSTEAAPPGDSETATPLVLDDTSGAAHRRYGAHDEALYLIRPDKYIGLRTQPAEAGLVLAYFDRILR